MNNKFKGLYDNQKTTFISNNTNYYQVINGTEMYYPEYVRHLQQELNDYKERNEKALDFVDRVITFCENDSQGAYDMCNMAIRNYKHIKEILDKKDEVVTIHRDMTHFFDGVAELDTTPLLSSEEILKMIREEERNRKNVDNTNI